jgi:starch phosphorylase
VISSIEETIYAGDELTISAAVRPGPFLAENLCVEVYHGKLDHEGKIRKGFRKRMAPEGKKGDMMMYKASIPCELGGRYGFTVRVLPGHKDLATDFLPGFVKWA